MNPLSTTRSLLSFVCEEAFVYAMTILCAISLGAFWLFEWGLDKLRGVDGSEDHFDL